MSQRARSVTRGLRVVAVTGLALVVLLEFGALGGANAAHAGCGTYCWNVYAPYTAPSITWSSSGSGDSWISGPAVTASNGQFIDEQQTSASNSWGDLYTTLLLQGDTIHFQTQVGVTYTFSIVVEAWYTINGYCDYPMGSYGGYATLTVTAGIVGTSYSTSNEPINAGQTGICDLLVPHATGASPGVSPIPMKSGGWGGYDTLTLAIPNLPSGYWVPYVEITGYTYADAQFLAGVTANLNFGAGGYYCQWTNLNINWGPGEG